MWLFLGAILLLIVSWLSWSFEIVKEDERGIKIRLGKPIPRILNPGLYFKIAGLEMIKKFTTKQQHFVCTLGDVVTRVEVTKGKVSTEEQKILEKTGKGHLHGVVKLPKVTVAVYYYIPRNAENLIKFIESAPDPNDIEATKDFFGKSAIDAVRIAFGKHTCEKRKQITKEVEKILTQEKNSPFARAGITKEEMHVVFKEIELPPDLAEALTKPEIAELEAIAKENEGRGQKEFLIKTGEGEAKAIEAIFGAIGDQIDKELLRTLRKLPSQSILLCLPSGVAEIFEKTINKKPNELLNMLSKEQCQELIKVLTKLAKEEK